MVPVHPVSGRKKIIISGGSGFVPVEARQNVTQRRGGHGRRRQDRRHTLKERGIFAEILVTLKNARQTHGPTPLPSA